MYFNFKRNIVNTNKTNDNVNELGDPPKKKNKTLAISLERRGNVANR